MYSISVKVKPNDCCSDRGYRFSYDGMSRLVNAEYGERFYIWSPI